MKWNTGRYMVVVSAVLVFFPYISKGDTVADILKKVDENLTKVNDQTYTGEIQVVRDGKTTKSFEFNVKLKGLHMKLVKFTAPGDVRGMTVLTTADGHMYVYLPSYKRVRRVASHVRNQGFMGTDLSPEDMGTASLSDGWNGTLKSQDKDKWILILKPKPGTTTTYSKIEATVLKKYGGVSELIYYSSQGKAVKKQNRDDWKTFGPITMPTLFTVKDLRTGSKTLMKFRDCKVNSGISERAFTKRAILRAD